MAKISIIVPFYKVPYEYMHQCLESILEQTFPDIEVILVDDGSPDDCGKICDEYQLLDERVVVIHKKNGGLSDARNAGIAAATSEWITFVDGDDWIEKDFCEHFIGRIEEEEKTADIYFFSGFRNYPSKVMEGVPHFADGTRFEDYKEREILQSKCFTIHLEKNGNRKGITISSAWAKMYRTDYMKEKNLLFPIIPYDEDSIFYLYAIEEAERVEYVANSVYHYRYTENSIVNKYRPDAMTEQKMYLRCIFDFAKKYNKSNEFVKLIYMRVMTSMLLLLKQYFFNPQNKTPYIYRRRECICFFHEEPFNSVYKNISFSGLGRNAKIKYILLKLKCYGMVEKIRKINTEKLVGKQDK